MSQMQQAKEPDWLKSSLCPIVSAWHAKHLFMKYLLVPYSCELFFSFFFFFEALGYLLLFRLGLVYKLHLPDYLQVSYSHATPICVKLHLYSPVILFYVNLIIRPAKEPNRVEVKILLPHMPTSYLCVFFFYNLSHI